MNIGEGQALKAAKLRGGPTGLQPYAKTRVFAALVLLEQL